MDRSIRELCTTKLEQLEVCLYTSLKPASCVKAAESSALLNYLTKASSVIYYAELPQTLACT